MNTMIDLTSKPCLLAFRDRVRATFSKFDLEFFADEVDMDQITADLIGASSWEEALACVKKYEQDDNLLAIQTKGWHCLLLGLIQDGYVSEADAQILLDEVVDDAVGTSETISEIINNAGPEAQIRAIAEERCLKVLENRLHVMIGLSREDMDEIRITAIQDAVQDPEGPNKPTKVRDLLSSR